MKSNNHENVMLSKARGVWSTPPQNEAKLNRAFNEYRNVILLFSVKESGKFQGLTLTFHPLSNEINAHIVAQRLRPIGIRISSRLAADSMGSPARS